ncbi:MAG: efflux RND transporter periplasmic adaptor subunit [Candidatus Krumholzibacteriota bacterium]|nr:efflux RND transporter periplasmic adaptor subunit [Candidatus Krumholzibacteriota bacterium]
MRQILGIIVVGLTLPAIILGLPGCGKNSHSKSKDKKDEKLVIPVEIARVITGDISAYYTGTASIEAEEETEVVAKVGGVVEQIMVEEGTPVREGDILVKLDDEMISVQLLQAEAMLNKLQNNYLRNKELHDKQLISAEEFQQVRYEYESQKAAYDMTKLNLDYTSIKTPIGGVVAERLIKVGNMIQPNQAVFRVAGMDPLIAILHVPERQLSKLRVGQKVLLNVDAIDKDEFSGRIKRISPIVDPATGTVKVTIETHDPSGKLRPGMFSRIRIIYDIHAHALMAPKDAIISEDKISSVFVLRDSTAYRQNIKIGYINTSHVEILFGLQEGDTLITTGKGSLKDSTRVNVVSP